MKNITYINAGAGSGKTYRLTEEMADKVDNNLCTPSQIIASTFTKDAAADLKKNAREKFLERGLFTGAAELDSAAIGTVHSIGFLYIKKYWYKLGLTASVEAITEEAKMSYLNRTLAKAVTDEDITHFREFVETFGLQLSQSSRPDYDFWRSLVKSIVEKADAFGIDDLAESEKKSLELAHHLFDPDGRFAPLNITTKSENELRTMYYDCIERIFKITRKWRKLFDTFKEEHGLIEFNDMESKFIQLLEYPDVQKDISQSIKYVFVDEFQDSNPKQIKIFDMLSDLVERSYWVGDPKQAIYGFRGCDTVLVQSLTDKIIDDKNKGINGMDYDTLKVSRRSVKPLVDTTSAVFKKVFDGYIDPAMITLTAHRTTSLPNNTPALWHWEQKKTLEAGQKRATPSKEKLFKSIARQIRDIVDGNHDIKYVIDKDSGESRKVKYSDIAVLARSNGDVTNITKALIDKDIPVVCESISDVNWKELRLARLLLNYIIDDAPLLKAEIAHLLYGQETKSVIEKTQDVLELSEFEKLDALKEQLKTLPVADIVKSLVVEMDLIHRCQKWGKADQRQRNLQALIEDAKTFDDNASAIGEASSIEHYLDHLDQEGVKVKEGFFQDGVHVLTYHSSKGLQWNIVILCSLDNDPSKDMPAKKKFLGGVNHCRVSAPSSAALYSQYYLTCLPGFLKTAQNNPSADISEELNSEVAFQQYWDRQFYEERRLLYVGVTRARDYLITTSLEGKGMPWLTASGITPVIDGSGDFRAIWGKDPDITESKFVSVKDDGSYTKAAAPADYLQRKDNDITTTFDNKYVSPSKIEDSELASRVHPNVLYPVKDTAPHPIRVVSSSDEEYDIMGTCIHNIFAIYRPDIHPDEMRAKAQRIIDAYKMTKMLPEVDGILRSIASLYQFMEQKYGKAVKVAHETPFRHETGGQVVSGEIDLLWYTSPKECVLVDFKNYPGILGNVLSPKKDEYVGKYAAQLDAYDNALRATGLDVKAKLIYYSVLGYVIQLDM